MARAEVIEAGLANASPLEMAKTLNELELNDQKEAMQVIEEVYQKFDTGEHLTENVIKPVLESVADGLFENWSLGRKLRKKGLTATRLYEECWNFTYDNEPDEKELNGYTEYKNMRDETGYDANYATRHDSRASMFTGKESYKNKRMVAEYKDNRKKFEDKDKMDKYKNDVYGDNRVIRDEYFGERDLNKEDSQTDHIIPLKVVYKQFRYNPALNNQDIKILANQRGNFAVTSGDFNNSKLAKLNEKMEQYKDQKNLTKIKLTEKEKTALKKASAMAQESINNEANKAVIKTLIGKGNVYVKTDRMYYNEIRDRMINKFIKQNGREPNNEELKNIKAVAKEKKHRRDQKKEKREKQLEKTKDLYKNLGKATGSQMIDSAIGNAIITVLKPVTYELKDLCANELMTKDLKAKNIAQSIKIRFKRALTYTLKYLKKIFVENFWETVKDFIKKFLSTFMEAIINCFVGVFKTVLKLLKEGAKILIKARKIMTGEEGKGLTDRQKKNAVIKFIGASVAALAGIGIELLLMNKGIPNDYVVPLSTILGGVISVAFMWLLNKADLFSCESEKRRDAITKIFDARIAEINEAAKAMDTTVITVLAKQRECYNKISAAMRQAIDTESYAELNEQIFLMAKFFKIELPYSNTESFIKHYDSVNELALE